MKRMDVLLPALAVVHAAVVLNAPTAPVIALGLWWNANTVSHNFIHRPFFRRRSANCLFAAYLSILLGFPQELWRARHLAHHAAIHARVRLSGELAIQLALVLLLWALIAFRAPRFFVSVYVPGYLAGLSLCALHGYYEHARGTTSYYGKLYNLLFVNDGYHVEHHANPAVPWACLPDHTVATARASSWPAPLRWMEAFSLQALERLVLKSRLLQWSVLRVHAHALRALVAQLPPVTRVGVVGGGLFPRTSMILQTLLPSARITIIDESRANLDRARAFISTERVEFVRARYPETIPGTYDLVVIPLSFKGNRDAMYARPPAPSVLVHDWLWRKRGVSRIVSVLLLKRINLVRR